LAQTLAACCLVHKSWLEIARKNLYLRIVVELFEVRVLRGGGGGGFEDNSDEDDSEWEFEGFRLTKRTTSLLETLQQNRHLASFPVSIILSSTEFDDEEGYVGATIEPQEALDLVLSLTPNVTALDLDNDPFEFDYVLDDRPTERYKAMKVAGSDAWCSLHRMQNLKHLEMFHVPSSIRPLPHPLETLICATTSAIDSSGRFRDFFHDLFHLTYSTLRTLSIPYTTFLGIDPRHLPNLEHLTVNLQTRAALAKQPSGGLVSGLQACRNLSTLTISGNAYGSASSDSLLKLWPDRLPDSLYRINLEQIPSLDVLLSIVSDAFSTSATTKQLSIWTRRNGTAKDLKHLATVRFMCESAGIELFSREMR